jgi:hypothetical protein
MWICFLLCTIPKCSFYFVIILENIETIMKI